MPQTKAAAAPRTRLTIELDDDLMAALDHSGRPAEDSIPARLAATIDYDLSGTPLFLNHDQHRRLRQISGQSAVGGTEALIERLESLARIGITGADPLQLSARYIERLASRAKIEGKTTGQLAAEYALEGIRERIGL